MSRSGYRFVPLNTKVVQAPVALEEIRHDRPQPGTHSGQITVEWTAETPVCVASGTKNDAGFQENVFIAGPEKDSKKGEYVLPGSTTGGAIRAVSEIAGFAHLGPINADRKYGARAMIAEKGKRNVVDEDARFDTSAKKIRMAWLEWVPDEPDDKGGITNKNGDGRWKIYYAGDSRTRENIYLVKFPELARYFQVDVSDWAKKTLTAKAALLSEAGQISQVNVLPSPRDRSGYHKAFVGELDKTGPSAVTGYVVCTGATVAEDTPKAHEYLFLPPKRDATSFDVHPEIMAEFNKIYSTPSNDGGVPLENWNFWLSQIGHAKWLIKAKNEYERVYDKVFGRRIPVFYTLSEGCDLPSLADAKSMYEAGVCFGLSPVLRVPHRYTVGDIAGRTYGAKAGDVYRVPAFSQGGSGWDMPTALFGAVEGVDQDRIADLDDTVRAALKGRVAFGFAIAKKVTGFEDQSGVFGVPRPSFEPFYLTGKDGYNDPDSRLSGRKRYPVRSRVNDFVIPNDNQNVVDKIRFLKAGSTFVQTIKFKNLKPEELGLLLWSIGFGSVNEAGKYRHAIGRAKGHGYGCMKTVITGFVANGMDRPEAAIEAFKAYILKALDEEAKSFEQLEPIQKLLAYANPAEGDRLKNSLTYPELGDFAKIREKDWKLEES